MAALASDWLRHFRLLLWNRWTEFNESFKMEAKSQHHLLSLCFSGWSEKQNGYPGLSLAEIIRLFLRNHWTEFNESWQEPRSQHPLPSLRFFLPISKQKWPLWLILQKGSTLYSGAHYVALWVACWHFWAQTSFLDRVVDKSNHQRLHPLQKLQDPP